MARRRPFDPSRVQVPESERLFPPAAASESGPQTLTPRQVNELLRGAIARHLPRTLHVLGEIGDLSRPPSGHLYFTLKDGDSELRCVMWRSQAVRMKFEPRVGMELIATGSLEVYLPRGAVQLIVRRLEPRGVGALELAFRQLREKLQGEGLFDPARKRPIPRFPTRIALVTSPSGAAIRDIVQTLRRRYPAVDVCVFPTRVQGEGAGRDVAQAIRTMNRAGAALGGIDVAIVGRGGGSLEDLWAFNEEVVARAIAASEVPIVSAVGHEVDVSIADLVADARAATPTAAAELVTPDLADLLQALHTAGRRALRAAGGIVVQARAELRSLSSSEPLARPLGVIRTHGQWLDEQQQRLNAGLTHCVRGGRARLERVMQTLWRFGDGGLCARLGRRLDARMASLQAVLGRHTDRKRRALGVLQDRLARTAPTARRARADETLRQLERRLVAGGRSLLGSAKSELRTCVRLLEACDPKEVLARGYSITRDAKTRKVVRSVSEIRDGQRIVTELADGEFRGTAEDPRQPSLFD